MLGNIWAGIQDYFSDWLQRTGGKGAYTLFEVDLSKAHTDERYDFYGDQIIVTNCDNAVTVKLNDKDNSEIDLSVIKEIHSPFNEFYITNVATSGTLKFLCGSEGVFQCDPSIRIISGKYGSQFKPVAIDSSGNIIMILKDPSSANYAAIDSNGYLTSVMKGDKAGSLKTVALDTDGNIISVIKDPSSANYVDVDSNGYLTSVMKGLEGANLRTIAVDSSGNIVGVFKGDYGGSLKTIAVDTNGRIQAVLTDPEDVFGNPSYMGAGELAVRNGSIVIHDKRGNVVLLEDFEGKANAWSYSFSGTGGSCALNQDFVFMGNWAVKMVGGSDTQVRATITRYFPLPASTKLGGAYCFTVDSNTDKIRIMQIYYDTTTQWQALMFIDTVNDRLQLETPSGTTTVADNIGFSTNNNIFHNAKLVIDYSTHKYVRAIIDDTEYDLSAYDLDSSASGSGPLMWHRFTVFSQAGTNPVSYVDNFIFTQNEPD